MHVEALGRSCVSVLLLLHRIARARRRRRRRPRRRSTSLITNAQIVDGTRRRAAQGIDRDQRRQDRRGRRGHRHRGADHRRQGPHRRARLHRHAQPLRHDADHRRQRPEQDPPGRDDGSDRRVGIGGAAQGGVGDARRGPTSTATSRRSKRAASRRTCCRTSALGTVREMVIGEDDARRPPQRSATMQQIVSSMMEQGMFGVSSGLIYPPNAFANVDELGEVAKAAARAGSTPRTCATTA